VWGTVFALVGLTLGFMAGLQLSARPTGQVVVLVRPLPGNAFSARAGDTLVDLKTESQLVFSDTVLGRVDGADGAAVDPALLRRRLSVRVVDNAEVVIISYRGDTSLAATGMAQRVAEGLLEVRGERAAAESEDRADVIESALTKSEQDLVTVSESGKDPEAVAVLGQRIVALRSDLRGVVGVQPSPGSILAASAPRQPDALRLRAGLAVSGVVVAGLLGLWFGRRPRRGPRWLRRRPVRARPAAQAW